MTVTIATPVVYMIGIMLFLPPLVTATDKYLAKWVAQTLLAVALLTFFMSAVAVIAAEITGIIHGT